MPNRITRRGSRHNGCPFYRLAARNSWGFVARPENRITGRTQDGLVLQLDSQSCSAQTSGLPC